MFKKINKYIYIYLGSPCRDYCEFIHCMLGLFKTSHVALIWTGDNFIVSPDKTLLQMHSKKKKKKISFNISINKEFMLLMTRGKTSRASSTKQDVSVTEKCFAAQCIGNLFIPSV